MTYAINERFDLCLGAIERDVAELRVCARKGHFYKASKILKRVKHCTYLLQQQCAHTSPRAAQEWGNGIRLPDGTLGIADYGL